jgi:anti-anti-sigma factor
MNDVRTSRVNGVPVIELRGEINSLSQTALEEAYDQVEKNLVDGAGPENRLILLDFQNVGFINSTGIALIVNLLSRARQAGVGLFACGLSSHYQEIFRITRLAEYIPVYPDVRSALSEAGLTR